MAFGFVEADLVAFGSVSAVKASIDARAANRNIVSNNEMMRLVNEIDNANAWAVGRFDAIAGKAGLPAEIASAMPAISWFSAAGHINGGVSGIFKAEAKDEATAKNLRDVVGGFLAMAKMQAGNKPGMQQLADSLVISGDGKTVALAFSIPTEVLDVLEGLAKGRQPARFSSNELAAHQAVRHVGRPRGVPAAVAVPRLMLGVISAAWETTSFSTAR